MNIDISLDRLFNVSRFVSLKDNITIAPPDYLPIEINAIFKEGTTCYTIGCYNAAATMFRLCLDIVSRPYLPDPEDKSVAQPNPRQRRDLGLRLAWLFDNALLPQELKELAKAIREDGNDGAHAGNLSKDEVDDIIDFTTAFLERLITEPEKLRLAQERRDARRVPPITT